MMPLPNMTNGTSLRYLLAGLTDIIVVPDLTVTGVQLDSRKIRQGDLFLACHGENSDGVQYIKNAVAAGAIAVAIEADHDIAKGLYSVPIIPVSELRMQAGVIVEHFFDEPSTDLRVVGITGTNGKTSVSWFLAQALSAYQEKPAGLVGTLGYGVYGDLTDSINTTPDAVTLHGLFKSLRDAGNKHVIMEASSHALQQGRVAGVNFDIAVFTNLSRDHLDYHESMSDYAAAKRRLFMSPELKFAVVNSDDNYGNELTADLQKKLPLVTYGLVQEFSTSHQLPLQVQGIIQQNLPGNLVLDINSPWGKGSLSTTLTGRFNAYNLLASLAVLCLLDMPFEQVLEKLSRLDCVPGRLECFANKNSANIFVDYAHTPDALQQVLMSLAENKTGKLICVFGCGGDRDKGKRPLMGQIAEQYADEVVLTSDNPRSEDPDSIINDIFAGMKKNVPVTLKPDRADAIRSTILAAGQDDIVLVAGKGHETYQEIAGKRYPFSDRQLIRNVLDGKV